MSQVTVVDYGYGNLFSVVQAFKTAGADVFVTDKPAECVAASRLVLPGVGAFRDCVSTLKSRGFWEVLDKYFETERPFLGLCVGMQVLFEKGEEFGTTEGLGALKGTIKKLELKEGRVPHIGWNTLVPKTETKLLKDISPESEGYFVHSFFADGCEDILAAAYYGGVQIPAMVGKGNIFGTQFHPEKSGKVGLQILRNFIEL
jgi:imidazole glycerol-phosphate synthase subunit HisH